MSQSQLVALKNDLERFRPNWLRTNAAGLVHLALFVILAGWISLVRPSITMMLVLAGPLVIDSLILRLADDPILGPVSTVVQWIRVLMVPAALLFTFASGIDNGLLSFCLAAPWMVLNLRILLVGVLRFISRQSMAETSLGLDAAVVALGLAGITAAAHVMGIGGAGSARAAVALTLCGAGLPAITAVLATIHGSPRLGLATTMLGLGSGIMFSLGGPTGLFVGSILLSLIAFPTVRSLVGTKTDAIPHAIQKSAALPIGLAAIAAVYQTASDRFSLDLPGDEWPLRIGVGCLLLGVTLALGAANWLSQPGKHEDELPLVHTKFHFGPRSAAQMELLREAAMRGEATPVPGLLTGDLRPGYRERSWSAPVADFENSCEALWAWAGHENAGVLLQPERPKITVGETIAMAVPLGPFTITTAVRIVSIVDEPDRYGFVFWALDHHIFTGQESFILHRTPNGAKATITTISKPSVLATTLLPPVSRALETSIALKCLEGIGDAEAAVIDERMTNLLSDLDSHEFSISREQVMNERAASLPSEPDEEPELEPTELEKLFAQPFDPAEESASS